MLQGDALGQCSRAMLQGNAQPKKLTGMPAVAEAAAITPAAAASVDTGMEMRAGANPGKVASTTIASAESEDPACPAAESGPWASILARSARSAAGRPAVPVTRTTARTSPWYAVCQGELFGTWLCTSPLCVPAKQWGKTWHVNMGTRRSRPGQRLPALLGKSDSGISTETSMQRSRTQEEGVGIPDPPRAGIWIACEGLVHVRILAAQVGIAVAHGSPCTMPGPETTVKVMFALER